MIVIKSPDDIELMRAAGKITKAALKLVGEHIRPGITTKELDKIAHEFILSSDATPSFLNYGGYPASICASINEVVIHGIPSNDIVIKDGDIVSIDMGACYKGFHGDCTDTFLVGNVSPQAAKLVEVTRNSFFEGIKFAKAGNRISDISNAIETYVKKFGYGIVDRYTGHGVGRDLHEDPQVPNYGRPGRGPRLVPGMTLAIEPMINIGTGDVIIKKDGWTVVTADLKLSAHYENTILITKDEAEILTI